MKFRVLAFTVTVTMLWCLSASVIASDQPTGKESSVVTAAGNPAAVLPTLKHEFEPVVDGTEITHDFSIKNTGDGPLAIERVKTG